MDSHRIARVYSAYSGFYDLLFGKIFHDSRATAIDLLGIRTGDRILEVGVGTGLSLPLYPPNCGLIAIDLTGAMLKQGVKKIKKLGVRNIHLQQMDATQMAFSDDQFDGVLAAYVMSTVPDPRTVLAEMIRVCRPGGRIVLLNHFTNGNRLISRVEKKLSPLCTRIGFRSDLSLDSLLRESSLLVDQNLKVNPLNYWHIVRCINRKPENGRSA